jgi:hypothetical protein
MTTASPAPKPAKFNFDTVFGTKGTPATSASNRTRSAYSAEEVEQIRREAHTAGKQAASAESTHAQAVALSAIAQGTHALIQQYDVQLQSLRAQSADLALAVGRKLAGAALAAAGLIDLEAYSGIPAARRASASAACWTRSLRNCVPSHDVTVKPGRAVRRDPSSN